MQSKNGDSALELINTLPQSECEGALALHELGLELGCKIEIKEMAKSRRIIYTQKNPKRVLFTIECGAVFRIKANLFNIAAYPCEPDRWPEEILHAIKATRACTGCNPGCSWHRPYTLGGQRYLPCYGSGHYFKALSPDGWKLLRKLLMFESAAL